MKATHNRHCPECNAVNRPHARTCTQCGAPLDAHWQDSRRLRNKILRRTDFMAAARANQRATRRLVLSLLLILGVLGYLIGWSLQLVMAELPEQTQSVWFLSRWGIWCALGLFTLGAGWSWVAFRSGDKIVLRLTGARRVTSAEEPMLHNVVAEMAIASGMPVPLVYLLPNEAAINAFAAGFKPGDAVIGVTRGCIKQLNRDELQGVVAHEFSHILNGDMRLNMRMNENDILNND